MDDAFEAFFIVDNKIGRDFLFFHQAESRGGKFRARQRDWILRQAVRGRRSRILSRRFCIIRRKIAVGDDAEQAATRVP